MTAFYLTYLRRELSQRGRQALLTAAGLAVGAGLVVTVTAASAGVSDAETAVLHSLYGVGTDVSVTKPAPDSSPGIHHLSTSGPSAPAMFSPGKKPLPVDRLTAAPGLDWLDASSVGRAARLAGVTVAAGGLTLTDAQFVVPSLAQVAHGQQLPANALPSPFTVDGVDLTHPALGPYADATLVAGRGFSVGQERSNVAVVDTGYARTHRLRAGSTVTIGFRHFTVIGLVSQPPAGAADAFIPLDRAEVLAAPTPTHPRAAMVTNIYVAAASAADIPAVRGELARLLPSATVSSSAGLASQVSGSLSGAATLTADLGRWLTGGALVAAFAAAGLLALAAISRRYTELGTLKALGWPGRRIIGQIMGESLVIGVVGAATGVAAGIDGAQATMLRSLYGVGTELTVTEPVQATGAAPPAGLAPGDLMAGDLGPVPYGRIDRLPYVASAAGGLLLSEILQSPGALPASITVDGADPAHPGLGPLGPGHGFGTGNGAVLDAGYASSKGLPVGSTITVAGARFRVTGIVRQPDGADIYIPLGRAQQLSKSPGDVNVVYVAADNAADVDMVRQEISRLLPAATVADSSSAARAVTGSLRDAAGLASDLGRWVGVAALGAAVAIAGLLTVAAVTRRVREFGTLRALGWPAGRIIGQVMGESVVIGVVGGVAGVAVGFAGTALVNGLAPRLAATVPAADGNRATVGVQLVCRVSPAVVSVTVLLAIGGAAVAGGLGAWRAARLQPANAFARIGLGELGRSPRRRHHDADLVALPAPAMACGSGTPPVQTEGATGEPRHLCD